MIDLKEWVKSVGPENFRQEFLAALATKKLRVEEVSYKQLAAACKYNDEDSQEQEHRTIFGSLFETTALALLAYKIKEGYDNDAGFVGDKLTTDLQKPPELYWDDKGSFVNGTKSFRPPIPTNYDKKHDYLTTTSSTSTKTLSIQAELVAFDQTGEINRRAMSLGYFLRQTKERTIIRGITEADCDAGRYVYRQGSPLYCEDGSNRNWVGRGNTTSPGAYSQPLPLHSKHDFLKAVDYRLDETYPGYSTRPTRPLYGTDSRQLLVPEVLRGQVMKALLWDNPHEFSVDIMSSPFIDEQGGRALKNWYLGEFKSQFVWQDIVPLTVSLYSKAESAATFLPHVAICIKAQYLGKIHAANSPICVTKIDGGD